MAQSAGEKQQTMQLVKRAIAHGTAGSPDPCQTLTFSRFNQSGAERSSRRCL